MKFYRVFRWSILTMALISQAAEVVDSHHAPNAENQRNKSYVLLIGLDGFRHDYAERFGATNLLALGKAGVQASGFVPVFPSETFPSMYSIATGLRPARHGLVANEFYDPQTGESFSFNDGKSPKESRWFGGTPLWVLAEQQGMRAANYFWVGSDAEIQGKHASYWVPFDKTVPNRERVQTVLKWFALPEILRPHFVTLYFSDVDTSGHRRGPDSAETAQAVRKVDADLGELFAGLRELPVKVNVIVVSDHGMTAIKPERIVLSKSADFTGVTVRGGGALVMYYSDDEARIDKLYRALHGKDSRFSVYRRKDLPEHLHYSGNSRIGDLVVISEGPYILTPEPRVNPPPAGNHGFDPATDPNMHGIFFAAGPNIKAGTKLEQVRSLDVYPLIAQILGLAPPGNLDGKFERVAPICRLDDAARDAKPRQAGHW
jgi:alkaline phosphatase D